MRRIRQIAFFVFTLGAVSGVQGQFQAPGGFPPGFHHALLDVLSGGPAFSGRARITVGNQVVNANVAMLAGCLRFEADSFVPGTNFPRAELPNVANLRSVIIARPDTNRIFLVYPSFNSYVETGYSSSKGMEASPAPTIKKTPVGLDKIGDQSYSKTAWDILEGNGEHYQVTVWQATNNSDFPVQIQIGEPPAVIDFQQVNFTPPDKNLFVPPATYYKYEGVQELILKSVEKSQATNSSP